MNTEIVETIWYNSGKLKTNLSSNGITINAGEFAAVSVDVWSDRTIAVAVCSGTKNIFLPYASDYQSWF